MEVNTEGYHLDWSHAINLSSTLSLSDYHNHFLARSKSIYIIVNSQDIQVTAGLAQLKTDKLPQKVHHLLGWLGSSQCYKMAIYCTQGRCTLCQQSHSCHRVTWFIWSQSSFQVVSKLYQSWPKVIPKSSPISTKVSAKLSQSCPKDR